MSYRGDIALGQTLDIKFTTRSFTTGAPTTLAGSPAVSAYVGNGTTEITSGITLSTDFDSRTGLNNVRVVASGGNGFAAQTDVQLVITAGTVGGTSVVGEVIGEFSIENRSALRPATAGQTLAINTAGEAATHEPLRVLETTVATLTSQTLFTLTAGSADNDAYNGMVVVFQDASTATQKAMGVIEDYVGATKTVTLIADPAVYTIAATDLVTLYAMASSAVLLNRLTASRANDLDNLGYLNEPISSRAPASDTSAIKTKTDQMAFTNAGKIDAAVLAAADLSQSAADKIWGSSFRTLTSGANVVLSKGVGLVGLNDVSAADIWTAGTRTLTSMGSLITDIWTYPTRTLTAAGTLAADVWTYSNRTLTSFGSLALDMWAASTRTLTSFGTLPADVWTSGTRTLTSFGTLAADVWSVGTRTLTSFGTVAADVWSVVLENSKTALQIIRLIYATTVNMTTDTQTGTIRFRDDANTKNRVTVTTDADNNRTSVTKDPT